MTRKIFQRRLIFSRSALTACGNGSSSSALTLPENYRIIKQRPLLPCPPMWCFSRLYIMTLRTLLSIFFSVTLLPTPHLSMPSNATVLSGAHLYLQRGRRLTNLLSAAILLSLAACVVGTINLLSRYKMLALSTFLQSQPPGRDPTGMTPLAGYETLSLSQSICHR